MDLYPLINMHEGHIKEEISKFIDIFKFSEKWRRNKPAISFHELLMALFTGLLNCPVIYNYQPGISFLEIRPGIRLPF